MKIKYIPGSYPVPMLMYYNEPNELSFQDIINNELILKIGNYTNKYNHIWNIGSYIIYDESSLEIKSLAINNFANFVWLLRTISKELIFEIDNESWIKILNDDDGKSFEDEFQIVSK